MALIVIIVCSIELVINVNGVAIRHEHQDVLLGKRSPFPNEDDTFLIAKRSPIPGHTVTSVTIDNKHLPKDSLQNQLPKEKPRFSFPFIHKRGQVEEGLLGQSPVSIANKMYYVTADKEPEVADEAANIITPQRAKHQMLLKENVFIKRKPTPAPTHFIMPNLYKQESHYTQSPSTEGIIIKSSHPSFASEERMRLNRGKQKLILAGDPLII